MFHGTNNRVLCWPAKDVGWGVTVYVCQDNVYDERYDNRRCIERMSSTWTDCDRSRVKGWCWLVFVVVYLRIVVIYKVIHRHVGTSRVL